MDKVGLSGKYQTYPEYKDSGEEWLGNIPMHWDCIKLKFVTNLEGNKVEQGSINKYVGMENIESWSGKYIQGEDIRSEGLSSSFTAGDVLFGKLRPYLAKSWVADFSGICSSEFLVLKSKIINPKFLNYFFLTEEFIKRVDSSTYGSKMPRASWDFIGLMGVSVPSITNSEQIANFLDHETAKIDTLIEKQQQLIKLLKEKRQAVISHAVTKGLNPNAPMRDSGVEWLGEVPEHWERKSLNYLISHTVDNRGRTPPIVDEGIPMVEVSQVAGNGFYTSNNYSKFVTEDAYDKFVRSSVEVNDILFVTVGATFGKTCLVPRSPDFFIAQNIVGFRCKRDVDPKFFMFLLSSSVFKEATSATNKSSTIDNIKVSDLVKTRLVVPSYEEQIEIANYIFTIVEKYENLVSKAESIIKLIQERRTALISAAVTGKIDVRDWVAPESSSNTMNSRLRGNDAELNAAVDLNKDADLSKEAGL